MARKARCVKGQTVMVPREIRERIDKLADEREVSIGDICREATQAGQRRITLRNRWPEDPPYGSRTDQVSWMDTEAIDSWIRRVINGDRNASVVRRALLLEGLRVVEREL